jgi:hypothetical protein
MVLRGGASPLRVESNSCARRLTDKASVFYTDDGGSIPSGRTKILLMDKSLIFADLRAQFRQRSVF